MNDSFANLSDGDFFRFPGRTALFKKIPLRYESTLEVNAQSLSNTFHFLNGPQIIIKVTESDPIPTTKELRKE